MSLPCLLAKKWHSPQKVVTITTWKYIVSIVAEQFTIFYSVCKVPSQPIYQTYAMEIAKAKLHSEEIKSAALSMTELCLAEVID